MAKIILMCGKICSGKSAYAKDFCEKNNAVLLSVDEIMLAMFGRDAGEKHDDYVEALEKYLFDQSIELLEKGIDVVFDIGLWTKSERTSAREFYRCHNVNCEIHYMDISDDEWHKRIEKRNKAIIEEDILAYYVDEGLINKLAALFEKPDRSEVDVWVNC